MSWMQGLAQRLRAVFRFSSVESELDRELRDHMDLEVQRQLAAGLSPENARRQAALRVGSLETLKEDARDERGGRMFSTEFWEQRFALEGGSSAADPIRGTHGGRSSADLDWTPALRGQPPSATSEPVDRAAHADRTTIEHMRGHHRRADVRVPKQLLHGPNVVPILEQVRRE
jgi:hypothetical protein